VLGDHQADFGARFVAFVGYVQHLHAVPRLEGGSLAVLDVGQIAQRVFGAGQARLYRLRAG